MNSLKKVSEWLKNSISPSTVKLEDLSLKQLVLDWLLISILVPLPIYLLRDYSDYIRLAVAMVIVVIITYFELAQKLIDIYENMRNRRL